jgi:hypothetical protein
VAPAAFVTASRVPKFRVAPAPPATHTDATVPETATLGVKEPAAQAPPTIATTITIAVKTTMYFFMTASLVLSYSFDLFILFFDSSYNYFL